MNTRPQQVGPLASLRAARSFRFAELVLIAALSLAPFFWRVLVGAGDLPAGDAWAYERIFDTLHTTGHLRLVGWNDITLVGVIPVTWLWVAIVGYGHHQLHLLGSVMCAAALLGFRSLLTTFGSGHRLAALALFGGFTGFVGVSGTYLSDSFANAGAICAVALACYVAYGERAERAELLDVVAVVASAICATLGFLVRQQMLIGAIAAGSVLWSLRRRRRSAATRLVVVYIAVFVAVSVPIYLWRSGLPNGGRIQFDLHPRGIVAGLEGWFIAEGMLLFGAMMWVPRWRRVGRAGAALAVGVSIAEFAFVAATWSHVRPSHPLVLGVQQQFGLLGGAVILIAILAAATTGWAWTVRACLYERVLATNGGRSLPSQPLVRIAALAIAVELAVVITTGAYFTRYSLLTACFALVAILAEPVRADRYAVLVTVVLLLGAFWELDHSIAPTDAVHRAAHVTACLGIPPDHLDATFSWDGQHYKGIASVFQGDLTADDGLPLTHDWSTFPAMERDAVLTPTRPGSRGTWLVIGPIATSGLMPGNEETWWLTVRRSAITASNPATCFPR